MHAVYIVFMRFMQVVVGVPPMSLALLTNASALIIVFGVYAPFRKVQVSLLFRRPAEGSRWQVWLMWLFMLLVIMRNFTNILSARLTKAAFVQVRETGSNVR